MVRDTSPCLWAGGKEALKWEVWLHQKEVVARGRRGFLSPGQAHFGQSGHHLTG